ncbi:MAG: hypothetical protein HUJ84_05535 [Veillonella sp.]|nr:hypothetical protein [Veillonella sp.]
MIKSLIDPDIQEVRLTEQLIENGIELEVKDFWGIGWYYEDVLCFIDLLNTFEQVILGGETYSVVDGKFEYLLEYNWSITGNDLFIDETLFERNKKQAKNTVIKIEKEGQDKGLKLVYRICSSTLEWLDRLQKNQLKLMLLSKCF